MFFFSLQKNLWKRELFGKNNFRVAVCLIVFVLVYGALSPSASPQGTKGPTH